MRYRTVSLAAYLPQFHEIEENNRWWGKGFTEWDHLKAAKLWNKRQIIRHPHGTLGFYNLLNPDVLERQYELAAQYGINGFSVWHYWFGNGEKLLEKPIEMVRDRKLNFKYSLSWANHSWMNRTKGLTLKEQKYLGVNDYKNYFFDSIEHFGSENYLKIDNRPIFSIFDPKSIPDLSIFIDLWQSLAIKSGFNGIYFIGDKLNSQDPQAQYFDKVSDGFAFWTTKKKLYANYFKEKLKTKLNLSWSPQVFEYSKMLRGAINFQEGEKYMPTVLTGWDTTPRHKHRGVLFNGYDPRSFGKHLEDVELFFKHVKQKNRVVLIKSWNEWAEGNALEPCEEYNFQFLEKYKEFLDRSNYL